MIPRWPACGNRTVTRHYPLLLALLAFAPGVQAYIGPGVGMGLFSAIAAFLGVLSLGLVSALWYPLKRSLRRRRQDDTDGETDTAPAGEDPQTPS